MSSTSSFQERVSEKYTIFSFSLLFSKNKRYVWGLFFAMFLPTAAIILLLNFTTEDLSGGGFWLWYYRIYFRIGLFFLVSLVALLIGTGMFRDELNDETIVYVMTRPVRRERIFLEKYCAYLVVSILVVTPGLITTHLAADIASRLYDSTFELTPFESLYNLIYEIAGAYIILIGLGAVFVSTGLALKRPLLINLIIAFGVIIEAFLLDIISNQFEPVYIAQNIVAKRVIGFLIVPEVSDGIYRFSLGPNYSEMDTFVNFVVILILTIMLGLRSARRKEIS